jgi:hypothetical protein
MSATCAAKEHWDTAILLTSVAKDELVFWRDNTARVAAFGMPILVPKFQQMLHMWERGGELADGQRPQYRLVSDGGPRWGATLSAWPIKNVVKPPLEGSGEYPAEWEGQGWCEHQAWREAVAALLAIKTFTPIIRGSVVLHLSDCACVVKALQEGGSATSAQVYRWAVEIWQWCVDHDIILLSGWVQGEEVVWLGADRLSREDGVDVHGYTAGPLMQAAVATVCRRRGYALTVDLFATVANKECPRFCSRFHDVGTEDVDAFTRPSWRVSRCVCGAASLPTHETIDAGIGAAGVRGLQGMYRCPETTVSALLEHIARWTGGGGDKCGRHGFAVANGGPQAAPRIQ